MNTAPLIAHFITFTRGKFTNISFILLLIMLVLIMAYNILVQSSKQKGDIILKVKDSKRNIEKSITLQAI